MKKIDEHIEAISISISKIDSTLAVQAEQLKSHIKRTEMLEARVKPLEDVAIAMKGFLKALTYLGIIATLLKILPHTLEKVATWLH